MATFFNPDEAVDRALLHEDIRDHADLGTVVDWVEDDIVAHFTKEGIQRWAVQDTVNGPHWFTENERDFTIELWGYNPTLTSAHGYNADRSLWTGFVKEMRKAIAKVTSHRLRHYDDNEAMKSEQIDGYSYERWRPRDLWPLGWDRGLRRYSTKPVLWAV